MMKKKKRRKKRQRNKKMEDLYKSEHEGNGRGERDDDQDHDWSRDDCCYVNVPDHHSYEREELESRWDFS